MKKTIFFLILAAVLCGTLSVYAQKPVYIYRNEGFIQTFITEEIDSITYSRIDADSILRSDYCMTEIHACDTVFRIPLASIDSISFVTPTTILKSGVFNIDEKLLQWVTDRDELTLYLNPSTPGNLLPEQGDIAVSLADVSSPIKGIFLGEVSVIKGENDRIVIECEPAAIEDAFERLYASDSGVRVSSSLTPDSRAGEFDQGWDVLEPKEMKVNLLAPLSNLPIPISALTYEPNDNLAFSLNDDPELSFSFKPSLKYHLSITYDHHYGTSFSLSLIGDYQLKEKIGLGGKVEFSQDQPILKGITPLAAGLANFFWEFGIYGKINLGIAIDKQWNQHFRSVFHWDWSQNAPAALKPVNNFQCINKSDEGNFAINGGIYAGLYLTAGFKFLPTKKSQIAEVNLRFEGGFGLEGTYLPFKSDVADAKTSPRFYNKLRNEKLESFTEFGLQAKAKAFKWAVSVVPKIGEIPLHSRIPYDNFFTVPSFRNLDLTQNDDNSIFVRTDVKDKVTGCDLGFALKQDGQFDDVDYVYTHMNYRGPNTLMTHVYHYKPSESDYKVYPLIRWMGIEMIGNTTSPIVGTWWLTEVRESTIEMSCMETFNEDGGYYYEEYDPISGEKVEWGKGTYVYDEETHRLYIELTEGDDAPYSWIDFCKIKDDEMERWDAEEEKAHYIYTKESSK